MRLVVHAAPVPITAGSECRVSGDVRRLGASLEEQFSSFETLEALCRFDRDDRQAPLTPGLILLDRRFPIWIALFEETVLVSIDTELLDGNPRARIRRAHEIIEFLRSAGYKVVIDAQVVRVYPDGISQRDLAACVAAVGGSRWFDLLTRDARFAFAFSAVGYALSTAVMDQWYHGAWLPLWTLAVRGLLFGSFTSAVQYWMARRRLTQRLDGIREAIVPGGRMYAPWAFRKSRTALAGDIAGLLVFGGFAMLGFMSGSWAIGLFIAAFWTAACVSLSVGFGRVLVLDSHSIEARARLVRTRIFVSRRAAGCAMARIRHDHRVIGTRLASRP
jgi:hypothetical protein